MKEAEHTVWVMGRGINAFSFRCHFCTDSRKHPVQLEPCEGSQTLAIALISVTSSALQSVLTANCACLPVTPVLFWHLMGPGLGLLCLRWWGALLLALLTLLLYAKHRRTISLLPSAELEQGIWFFFLVFL